MTEQQAIKYLFCSGMSELQVNTVVKAIREPYIKAIEDIRAEIKDLDAYSCKEGAWYLDKALSVIDKHDPSKAEPVGNPDKLEKETI